MANVASAPATDSSQAADSDGVHRTATEVAPDSSSSSRQPVGNSHSNSGTANSGVRQRMSGATVAVDGAYEPPVNGGGTREGSAQPEVVRKKPFMFAICFLGIFFSYFIYGLIQETVTKRKFGGEYFRFVVTLVFIQCVVNATFARVACFITKSEATLAPYNFFSLLSFTYVGAMVTSNASLAYISYPTQVLGKSAKPIPVLLIAMLVGGKRYSYIKYLIVLLIVGGVSLFLYKEGQQTSGPDHYKLLGTLGLGELLVLVSLVMDGLSAALQEKLRDRSVGPFQMMYAVNVFSAVYLGLTSVVMGELGQVVQFIQRHPIILGNIAAFSLSSAIGQNFIFWTVIHFGPLTTSIITTTRKFFTILGSVIIFGNALLLRQWMGVFLVFLGLGIDIFYGKSFKS